MKYKIKDSVDLFLSDEKYLTAYYMNTRQRKSFMVNNELVHLLENIDGNKSMDDIYLIMESEYGVDKESVDFVIEMMVQNRIITEVNKNNSILLQEDTDRFNRQINYFSEFLGSEEDALKVQNKLGNTHVIIFGCGAIGGNIALELVMAGIREITLYDFDDVENSDLCRHMYFVQNTIGMTKIESLKKQLELIDKKVVVHLVNENMRPDQSIEKLIEKSDFVVNTLDEPYIGYTSAKISRVCVKYNVPHFIAGGFDAHLASTGELIVPYVTPCVECYATHFKEKLKNWKPKKHPVKSRDVEIGGLPSMSLFSSAYAAIEIIKYISGLIEDKESYKVRGEMLFTDMNLTYLDVKRNPTCPVCGGVDYES